MTPMTATANNVNDPKEKEAPLRIQPIHFYLFVSLLLCPADF